MNICDNRMVTTYLTIYKSFYSDPLVDQGWKCKVCTFAFVNPVVGREKFNKTYNVLVYLNGGWIKTL